MKQRSLPFWLVCDLVCWLGVIFSFPAFAKALHRIAMATHAEGRGIRRSELSLLARLLVEAEAWIAYAIQRHAFKLAGLKPSRVRFDYPTPATTMRALLRRARQLMAANQAMHARAQAAARRLLRLQAKPCAATTAATAAGISKTRHPLTAPRARRNRAVSGQSARAAATTTGLSAANTRSGMRVRAPPWRLAPAVRRQPPRSASFRGRTPLWTQHAPAARRRQFNGHGDG